MITAERDEIDIERFAENSCHGLPQGQTLLTPVSLATQNYGAAMNILVTTNIGPSTVSTHGETPMQSVIANNDHSAVHGRPHSHPMLCSLMYRMQRV